MIKDQINKLIIGIDVSKDKLDVMILPNRHHRIVLNKKGDISRFLNKIMKLGEIELVVMESTGGYEKQLIMELIKAKLPLHVAHPSRVFYFARSKGYFAKTDKIDAGILAQYGQQEDVQPQQIDIEHSAKLRELASRERQLKASLTGERSRLKHVFYCSEMARSIKRMIKNLNSEIQLIEEKIDKMLENDETMKEKLKILQSFKGVGKVVSRTLVAHLPELGTLSRGQIARLAGVAPCNKDSGKKKGHRSTKGGRAQIKQMLYMSALVAMKHNKKSKLFYESLIGRGKEPKVALMALMRKIIITLNVMVRENEMWQKDRGLFSA